MNEREKRSLHGEEDEDKNERRRESKKKERMKEGEIDKKKEKPVTGSDRKRRREQATKSEKGRWGWKNKATIFRCLHHRCKCCAPLPKISCHPLTLGDIKSTSLSL